MPPYNIDIEKLSPEEKIQLAKAIIVSIKKELKMQDNNPLSKEVMKFLNEEIDSYTKNPDEGSAWDEIKERIRKK